MWNHQSSFIWQTTEGYSIGKKMHQWHQELYQRSFKEPTVPNKEIHTK